MSRLLSMLLCSWLAALGTAAAADAERGAMLYLRLPDGQASCVNCHGSDPAASRNNLLRAAAQPEVLLKTLNSIGVMGYLKAALGDADIEDLAAYLDAVARAAAAAERTVWPRTIEFGQLPPGVASAPHEVRLRNQSAAPLPVSPPRLARGRFMLSHDCPPLLAPGAECRASLRAVTAVPVAAGDFTDSLLWPGPVPVVVGVSAAASGAPGGSLLAVETEIDFGSVGVSETSQRRLTLRNEGVTAVTLGVATLTGPGAGAFALGEGCATGSVLAVAATCTVELRFRPGAGAAYTAALQWRSDGGNPAPVRLLAQGKVPNSELPAPAGGATGGGGCAAAPPASKGDFSLPLWLAAAASALGWRRHKSARLRTAGPA
jgi:cytochrome c553